MHNLRSDGQTNCFATYFDHQLRTTPDNLVNLHGQISSYEIDEMGMFVRGMIKADSYPPKGAEATGKTLFVQPEEPREILHDNWRASRRHINKQG